MQKFILESILKKVQKEKFMHKEKILIVDDEPKIIHLVREILSASGYEVIAAMNGERALEMAVLEKPELIILDIVLGNKIDGYEVTRRLRKFSDVPIIMLTAKVRESDLLEGFESGADDFLTKPFSAKELLVRMRAVMRRSQQDGRGALDAEINCGRLKIDLARRQVKVGDREVKLTPTEFKLLQELAGHLNQVMLHEQLLTAVWGAAYRDDKEYLRAYIRYLRKKIEEDPASPKYILRCPGVGYSLVCPEEREVK